jgi:hypothetical protein
MAIKVVLPRQVKRPIAPDASAECPDEYLIGWWDAEEGLPPSTPWLQ